LGLTTPHWLPPFSLSLSSLCFNYNKKLVLLHLLFIWGVPALPTNFFSLSLFNREIFSCGVSFSACSQLHYYLLSCSVHFLFQFLSLMFYCLFFCYHPLLSFSGQFPFQVPVTTVYPSVSLPVSCPVLSFSGHFPNPVIVTTVLLSVFPSCPVLFRPLYGIFHLLVPVTSVYLSVFPSFPVTLLSFLLAVPDVTTYIPVCVSILSFPVLFLAIFLFQFL
jgi:hypothetical protein